MRDSLSKDGSLAHRPSSVAVMKKTLRESLADYDVTMLRALADVRGAALTSGTDESHDEPED